MIYTQVLNRGGQGMRSPLDSLTWGGTLRPLGAGSEKGYFMDNKGRPIPGFEFDERKSRINKLKHGIDFVEAQELWLDEDLDRFRVEREAEPRFLVIGRIGSKHWTAVVTYRAENVRLISVRRSRAEEVEAHGR